MPYYRFLVTKKGELDLKDCFSDKSDRQEAVIYIEVDRHTDKKNAGRFKRSTAANSEGNLPSC